MADTKKVEEVKDERVYKLIRPFTFEDQEIKELVLDFESLTGSDIMSAEQEMNNLQGNTPRFIPVMNLDTAFQAAVSAKAANVYIGVIHAMSAKDFIAVTSRARNFLLGTD